MTVKRWVAEFPDQSKLKVTYWVDEREFMVQTEPNSHGESRMATEAQRDIEDGTPRIAPYGTAPYDPENTYEHLMAYGALNIFGPRSYANKAPGLNL